MTLLLPLTLLLAPTARSQAYVQALAAANMAPSAVVLLKGAPRRRPVSNAAEPPVIEGLFLPDLDQSLDDSLERLSWPTRRVESADVNDHLVLNAVQAAGQPLCVYSGPSGHLAGDALLATTRLLHCHSGRLPHYRGSTTLFYSLLAEGRCTVSALLLETAIDCGPILAVRDYPPPPPGMDVDNIYDAAIRADMLVRVVGRLAQGDPLDRGEQQNGTFPPWTYYIIHPVLKHAALLSKLRGRS